MRIRRGTWLEASKHAFVLATIVVALLPIIWVCTSALRATKDFYRLPQSFFPREWTLGNFALAFHDYPQLWDYFANTVVICAVVVPASVLVCSLAGYAFARLPFPGRNKIFWFLVATMFFPVGIARIFSIYELTAKMKLLDTRLGLILPYSSSGLVAYIFILRGMFQEIPRELEDAAHIDGASAFRVFTQIMVPLARNGIVVVGVLSLIGTWGEYILARYLTSQRAVPLAYGMTFMQAALGIDSSFPVLSSVYVFAVLPIIAIFAILQPAFMKGLMHGALKF
jgi:ABC-type glycerol-3-phosphate transport system permease component